MSPHNILLKLIIFSTYSMIESISSIKSLYIGSHSKSKFSIIQSTSSIKFLNNKINIIINKFLIDEINIINQVSYWLNQHIQLIFLNSRSASIHTITLPFYYHVSKLLDHFMNNSTHKYIIITPQHTRKENTRFDILNQGLKIHLPQSTNQTSQNFSFSFSLSFQPNEIYSNMESP